MAARPRAPIVLKVRYEPDPAAMRRAVEYLLARAMSRAAAADTAPEESPQPARTD